jgi:hypothetical protein
MRLFALLILSPLLLPISAVQAEPMEDRVVGLLQDVCISATTPEGMIDAGNKRAAAEGWKLLRSGPAPLPIMHNHDGPKVSFESAWAIELPDGLKADLWISIVRPEMPGVRHSICVIEPAPAIEAGALARTLEESFGSRIIRDTRVSRKWFFDEETQRGNCRWIAVSERPVGLMY